MSYCRPAGLSDDEEDDDEFEFSNQYDYNYRDGYKQEEKEESEGSLFYTAIQNEDINTMKSLLDGGFNVDEPLKGGWSPLMHACSLGSLSVVQFLVESQANVNFSKELFTPLMALCKLTSKHDEERGKCFDVLLKSGVNVNATDRNACTALMYACTSGHIQLVERLLDCKCNVNIQDTEGWSALFHAVNEGSEDIICKLIESKARVDLIDRRRRSAYELAMQKGYDHIAKIVCSKKEKRRLLREEENLPNLEEKKKDAIQELFAQLPTNNAKSSSGFSSDVGKMLWSMGLGHFAKQFTTNKIQLNELLLITDDHLKELGVRFSVHRQRILNSIRKFHLHQWSKSSLGVKPRNEQMYLEDAVKVMCNIVKHLHVLTATMNYTKTYQPVPIKPDVFRVCANAIHQLDLINGELNAILCFSKNKKEKERIEPIDLIKPKKGSHSRYIPIITTTVIFSLFLWQKYHYLFQNVII